MSWLCVSYLPMNKNNVLRRRMSLVINSFIEFFSSFMGFVVIEDSFFNSFSRPFSSIDGCNVISINVPKAHTTANTVNTKVLIDLSNSSLSRSTKIINMFPIHILRTKIYYANLGFVHIVESTLYYMYGYGVL